MKYLPDFSVSRTLVAIFSVCALSLTAAAQSPWPRAGDAGPIVLNAPTGVRAPVGWNVAGLFSVLPTVAAPADLCIGPGGHLYFTASSGSYCNLPSATTVYRVLMNGANPVQPVSVLPFSTLPIQAHMLTYDAPLNMLYSAGTCDQTTEVYSISATGVTAVLNPTVPINDPDGVAVGRLPGMTNPMLFVAAQDSLYAIDLVTQSVTNVPVNMAALGGGSLGNWNFIQYDPNTDTLLGTNVGSPTTVRTVEFSFTTSGGLAATAAEIYPTTLRPLGIDWDGTRYFGTSNQIGFLNLVAGNLFSPVFQMAAGSARAAISSVLGNIFLLDQSTGAVSRVSPSFRANQKNVSALAGGTMTYTIDNSPLRAGSPYFIFASFTGASPGSATTIGLTAPVNYDELTQTAFFAVLGGAPQLLGWNGLLDANGDATAAAVIPPATIPGNLTLHFCYILGVPHEFSNAVWFHVNP